MLDLRLRSNLSEISHLPHGSGRWTPRLIHLRELFHPRHGKLAAWVLGAEVGNWCHLTHLHGFVHGVPLTENLACLLVVVSVLTHVIIKCLI